MRAISAFRAGIVIVLFSACAAVAKPVIFVFPRAFHGPVLIEERADYPAAPRDNFGRYVIPVPTSGYVRLRKPSGRQLCCGTSGTLLARYKDGAVIPVDPRSGLGLYGFAGHTGYQHDWYTYWFLGTEIESQAFFDVPGGYVQQAAWEEAHHLRTP